MEKFLQKPRPEGMTDRMHMAFVKVIKSNIELMKREGPAYDKWQLGMIDWVEREIKRREIKDESKGVRNSKTD